MPERLFLSISVRAEHVEVPRVSTLFFNGPLIQSDEQARLVYDLYEGSFTATAAYALHSWGLKHTRSILLIFIVQIIILNSNITLQIIFMENM